MNSVKKFLKNQRNWLAELQEAQFDRGERELVALLKDESIKYYPVPTYAVVLLAWVFILLFP